MYRYPSSKLKLINVPRAKKFEKLVNTSGSRSLNTTYWVKSKFKKNFDSRKQNQGMVFLPFRRNFYVRYFTF